MAQAPPMDMFPLDEHDEYVSASEFQKHPLARQNPWLRPDPDTYRYDRLPAEQDPYQELVSRGAKYAGELVEVLDVEPEFDDGEPHTLRGEAYIRTSPFSPIQTVRISELEPIERWEVSWDTRVKVPDYYEHEIEFKEELTSATPIDVYCSSVNRRWGWRWKLVSFYEARPGVRESCEELIVDSGVNRWGSPDDVLQAAAKVDADWVLATDVTGMEDPSLKAHNDSMPTTDEPGIETQFDAVLRGIGLFIERADEVGCLHKTILPLQPPYDEFLNAVEERGWLDMLKESGHLDGVYVAVGGLLTIDDVQDRIDALHLVRERVGSEAKIHALAPGTDVKMLRELRAHPELIDSLDVSTPERAPGNNKIPDATWKQQQRLLPFGKDISTVRGAYSSALALQLSHMLSPLCKDRTFEEALDRLESDGEGEEDELTAEEAAQEAGYKTIDQWAVS